ncbi:efflux transporter, outer membrane factor (OMF) lipoprotein, NodT family [Luteibacter sp. UNCMF331Sha3.1]|uniref:efflux transporter outer membrane subunit n=1 Tax=Luteibacter sp. UNCMF331Sha3.1 TaxID=1502760 RepID=UPI0008C44ADC|nr:TolC family protein [Luteibacter sp. UNCMF331Sha3.1]SEN11712.1 efflux transporter, outer membrane factor (OMF) lipoprotein, NodT family [Luteibacter sp. UNCMF331Sha3.1]
MRTKLIPLVVVLGLAGCTVGPDYVKPDVQAATSWHNEADLQARKASPAPALDEWWKGFDDPELVTIVSRVLDQNLDLAASAARVDQARATVEHAHAGRLPQGSVDGSVARSRQSERAPIGKIASNFPGYDRNQTFEEIGAGASWELDLAGGLRRGEEAARDEFAAAEATHAGVRVSLAAEAADAYFRVRGAQTRIRIAEDQIKNEQGLVDLVNLRTGKGLGTARESAQAEALLLQAKATIPPLRAELDIQLNRLDVLMGAAPGTYAAEILGDKGVFSVPTIVAAGGPASLLRRRPDVIAAERTLAASNARIGVALAEYYPSVSLSSLLGFASLDTGKLFTGSALQPQAALGLHWRLFDFGRVDAEVKQARGANAEALANYRGAMLRATEDVENAIVSLSQLEAQHAMLTDEVNAHVRARDAAQDAYTGGAVSLIEVLDEDRQLLAARDLLARVHTDDARSAVAAFRALGGGWNAPAGDSVAAGP